MLHEGGIAQVDGDRKKDDAWYYEWSMLSRPSYTWGGAMNFYRHLNNHSTNVTRIYSTADIEIGDIISFDTNPNDGVFAIGHNVVVTKKDGNSWKDIYLTYHSTDREDFPANILMEYPNNWKAYAWSIN